MNKFILMGMHFILTALTVIYLPSFIIQIKRSTETSTKDLILGGIGLSGLITIYVFKFIIN